MGANLGIGGQVVNDNCIQCPFHGWLFNGETGQCVGKNIIILDHDGKPVMAKTIEYNDDFANADCKHVSWKEGSETPKQRKFATKEINTFIYVWIHSDPSVEPYFMMLNNEEWIAKYDNRGQTIHDIMCHIQDIP
jgi:cholesterol 7-dehydrogenase